MKRGLGAWGYTLLEVMIVLAVSSGLLISAVALISGQREKTEFSQAIREIDSQIQDVINDVATGYYANTGDFRCTGNTGRPVLERSSGDTQGSNRDCIFIGRVMQFGVEGTDREGFNVFNVVGLRQALSGGSSVNTSTLFQAKPTAMAPDRDDPANYPNTTENKKLQYGLRLSSMTVNGQPVGAVGFFGSLTPGGLSGGNLISGAQSVELVPIPGTTLDNSAATTVEAVNRLDTATVSPNPSSGVVLCFQSGGTNEYALITIGGGGRRLTTSREVRRGTCPA